MGVEVGADGDQGAGLDERREKICGAGYEESEVMVKRGGAWDLSTCSLSNLGSGRL